MRLAPCRRIEGGETLESHGRDDRLQTRDADRIAANVDVDKYATRTSLACWREQLASLRQHIEAFAASRVRWRQALACP
ncbi:hypothetical protein CA601_09910 [Paraburkholderia hospita]|nr:hypothetical protein CA601_09910 [Paraburkholderia hospita]